MFIEGIFQITLIVAAFLSALVAGLLFVFAIVVMPGIKRLPDREFIRAFQVMDGVIQNNQPLFVLVWMGSVVTLLAAAVIGLGQLDGVGRLLIVAATVAYIFGVQLPTLAINVPLNNKLQALDVAAASDTEQKMARSAFEPRWNRWNAIRTTLASLSSVLLMTLLLIV